MFTKYEFVFCLKTYPFAKMTKTDLIKHKLLDKISFATLLDFS